MLNKVKSRKQEGFTIIEVLIVLAIAGLILLIVFLAVPALQRSSRNTTIKNDAASLAGGMSEYSSNNGGAAPGSPLAVANGVVTIGTAGVKSTAKVNGSTTVTVAKGKPAAANQAYGTLYWDTGTACDGTVSARAVSVYYVPESSGVAATAQTIACVDSN